MCYRRNNTFGFIVSFLIISVNWLIATVLWLKSLFTCLLLYLFCRFVKNYF